VFRTFVVGIGSSYPGWVGTVGQDGRISTSSGPVRHWGPVGCYFPLPGLADQRYHTLGDVIETQTTNNFVSCVLGLRKGLPDEGSPWS
jgi:hypothetical protein